MIIQDTEDVIIYKYSSCNRERKAHWTSLELEYQPNFVIYENEWLVLRNRFPVYSFPDTETPTSWAYNAVHLDAIEIFDTTIPVNHPRCKYVNNYIKNNKIYTRYYIIQGE